MEILKTKIKLIPNLVSSRSLTIHPQLATKLSLNKEEKRIINFGILSWDSKIVISSEIEPDEIIVSPKIIEALKIPLAPKYEIQLNSNQLVFGPYIGILAAKTNDKLDQIVNNLSNYVYHYQNIGGAILAFSLDGVDRENKLIRGYIFNPLKQQWDLGFYPYPSAILQRININRCWKNHFQTTIGNCIFNNYIFDKWEMHKWLSKNSKVNSFLPETILYRKAKDLFWFLENHPKAYVKPLSGSQGTGVIEASKKGNFVLLRYRIGEQNCEAYCESTQELETIFKLILSKGRYIIQQGIDLITQEDRIIDFRLLIIKNQFGDWEDMGMIGRYSKPKSVISNISGGGRAELGEDTLKEVLQLTDEEVYKLRIQLSRVAMEAAKSIEACGIHCGNLGIDLGLDKKQQIWIIEINNRDPNHTIAIDAGSRKIFYQVKLANMLYAKKLAGFAKEL